MAEFSAVFQEYRAVKNDPEKSPASLSPKEQAYQSLKEWIIYSELKPGDPLNERDLAESFGISRTPLREVLQRLCYQRLIVIRPRQGIYVAPIDFFMIRDIFEARLPLERSVAALAARRATPEHIARLDELVEQMRELEENDLSRLIRLDQVFHETLAEAAGNKVLTEMMEDLHNVCLRFWNLSGEARDRRYRGVEELAKLMDAVRAGDSAEAARLLATHILSFLSIYDESSAEMLSRLALVHEEPEPSP